MRGAAAVEASNAALQQDMVPAWRVHATATGAPGAIGRPRSFLTSPRPRQGVDHSRGRLSTTPGLQLVQVEVGDTAVLTGHVPLLLLLPRHTHRWTYVQNGSGGQLVIFTSAEVSGSQNGEAECAKIRPGRTLQALEGKRFVLPWEKWVEHQWEGSRRLQHLETREAGRAV